MKLQAAILQRWKWVLFLAIPVISLFMHLGIFDDELGGIHAWRQTETASNVLIFHRQHDPIYNPRVFHLDFQPNGLKRMEFPIMQYVMALGYDVFGEHVWVLRVGSWIIGILGIWGMFYLVWGIFRDRMTALMGAWAYTFSPVLFYYAVNPLPDNLALASGIWGLAFFVGWYRSRKYWMLWASAFALMISTLAKLPFIVFYMLPLAYIVQDALRSRFKTVGKNLGQGIPFLLLAAPALAWYAWVIPTWDNGVTTGILSASGDDWGDIIKILLHTAVSTLPELLVNYAAVLFFLLGLVWMWGRDYRKHVLFIPLVAWAVLIFAYYLFEVNMIATKHDYYLFPFMPGVFLIVACGMGVLFGSGQFWLRRLVLLILLVLPVTAALRAYPRWKSPAKLNALVEHISELRAAVPEDSRIVIGHDLSPHIYLYNMQRFGWNFDKEKLAPDHIKRAMAGGAEYYISDDRDLDVHPLVVPILGEKVAEIGPFFVYKINPN